MYEKSVGQISIITEQDMLGMSWLKFWQSFIEICRLENWDSDFHFFHNNYSENTNFELFIEKSIHLYIHNHFTTYFIARASFSTVIRRIHPMDHECKAAHKFQHFKILVDFQGFTCQASWYRPVRRTQSIRVDSTSSYPLWPTCYPLSPTDRSYMYCSQIRMTDWPYCCLLSPTDRTAKTDPTQHNQYPRLLYCIFLSFLKYLNLCSNFVRSFASMIHGMHMMNDSA